MRLIDPDFARRIDLPGAGPCPRPVDIDQGVTGFADLVSLRVYSFAAGIAIHGEAEGDELFVILVRGAVGLAVHAGGRQVGAFTLDDSGEARAIYMPPGSEYHLTATDDADVAYARVRGGAAVARPAGAFAPADGRTTGTAAGMSFVLAAITAGGGLPLGDPATERLVHLRVADGGDAAIDGTAMADWQTARLGPGDGGTLRVRKGAADVLLVSATRT